MKEFRLPYEVETVLEMICQSGFSAYLVGGSVRDFLMGKEPSDYDITTSALPEDIEFIFRKFITFDSGKKYGTISVVFNTFIIEITTMRKEVGYSDGRRPDEVIFSDSILEDLMRRDFTMNAIAYSHKSGIYDPFNGKRDIENMLIRAVGNPNERFREDGLRILRCLRFAAVLGFKIDDETSCAIDECRDMLGHIANERIKEELDKLLCGKNISFVLEKKSNILFYIIPELQPMYGFLQYSKYHNLDVWEHTIAVMAHVPKDKVLRLAALLHDIGKPRAFIMDKGGRGHFKGHEAIGAEMSKEILQRLKYKSSDIERIYKIILWHRDENIKDEYWIRKTLSKMGSEEGCREILCIMRADALAKVREYQDTDTIDYAVRLLDKIISRGDAYSLKQLAVNGNDLLEMGIEKGKIGKTLDMLLECVLKNPNMNDKALLIKMIK